MPKYPAERRYRRSVDCERRKTFARDTVSQRVQADVLPVEINPGRPVVSRRVHSEVTFLASVLFVATHGLAYSRQTFRHLADLPII